MRQRAIRAETRRLILDAAYGLFEEKGFHQATMRELAARAGVSLGAIFQHFPGYLGAGKNAWRTTPVSLIQSGDWKLMEFLEDGRLELYNLRDDIGETKNLANVMPDKAKELHTRLLAWRAEVKAPMPNKNDVPAAPQPKKGRREG